MKRSRRCRKPRLRFGRTCDFEAKPCPCRGKEIARTAATPSHSGGGHSSLFLVVPAALSTWLLPDVASPAEEGIEKRASIVCAGIKQLSGASKGSVSVRELDVRAETDGTITFAAGGVNLEHFEKGTYGQYEDCLMKVMQILFERATTTESAGQPLSRPPPLPGRAPLPSPNPSAEPIVLGNPSGSLEFAKVTDALARRLQRLGQPVAASQPDAGANVEIDNIVVNGPNPIGEGRVEWLTSVRIDVLIRDPRTDIANKPAPFSATDISDDPVASRSSALLKAVGAIADYILAGRRR